MDKERRQKVLEAASPYRELFGVDKLPRGAGPGRRVGDGTGDGGEVLAPLPDIQVVPDRSLAQKLTMKATVRTMQVLKHLYADEFSSIYARELAGELDRTDPLLLGGGHRKFNRKAVR